MPRYSVTLMVEFEGEIEAESREEAERLAIYDDTCQFQGVYSIETKELDDEEDEDFPVGEYGGMEDSRDW